MRYTDMPKFRVYESTMANTCAIFLFTFSSFALCVSCHILTSSHRPRTLVFCTHFSIVAAQRALVALAAIFIFVFGALFQFGSLVCMRVRASERAIAQPYTHVFLYIKLKSIAYVRLPPNFGYFLCLASMCVLRHMYDVPNNSVRMCVPYICFVCSTI